MSELNPDGFADFFQCLWGYAPFAWQAALARRVMENSEQPWPEAIALPTAAGKTACIDIAVYALAARSGSVPRPARRIFFCVDRRIIVDEAFERAQRLAYKLMAAEMGIVREVADKLRALAGSDIPLMCFQLRGGMYRSDAWARSPLQPALIATTVDQLGSRLLFRAYGRSPKAWPIQASLAANDALVLLDEAHCSQPFMETLQAVRKYRQWADQPLPCSFQVTILSATPPAVGDIFEDCSEERRTLGHPLGDRQMAPKTTQLVVSPAQGKNAKFQMAAELAAQAEALVKDRPLAAVVFANYVVTARETYRLLRARHGEKVILLTGRMRSIDKEDTIQNRLRQFELASGLSATRHLAAPVFVVATQTLEVGADMDFDVLVTECASLDALRQRFGRLNRMGRNIVARGAILMRADYLSSSVEDPIYGEALSRSWQWLTQQAEDSNAIDMGIAAMANHLRDNEQLASMNAPTAHAPVMLPAHLDCWVQTQPEPVPSPEVALYLHGPGRAAADVQVCWRADIDLRTPETVRAALDALALCPPSAPECLPVPLWQMRRWLEKRETASDRVADVEGMPAPESPEDTGRGQVPRRAIRWRGREEADVISGAAAAMRPGDVIVISAREANWEDLGDFSVAENGLPMLDWGDRAHAASRAKALLRLHPDVIAMWPEHSTKAMFCELAQNSREGWDEDPEGIIAALARAIATLADDRTAPPWLQTIAATLRKTSSGLARGVTPHPAGVGFIVKSANYIEKPVTDAIQAEVDWFSDEDDASASGTIYVPLEAHLAGVGALAGLFAEGCALSELAGPLACAGKYHDIGKADPRFQALLHGGNPWAKGELLAKSADLPQGRTSFSRARHTAGYPVNGRHELQAIRLLESELSVLPDEQELRDLVLHLIESHHGHCRPFAPVVEDPLPVGIAITTFGSTFSAVSDTRLERLDSGVAQRFWRLTRRYGWWGLAWLEAIVRLADHRRSEWEEHHRRPSP